MFKLAPTVTTIVGLNLSARLPAVGAQISDHDSSHHAPLRTGRLGVMAGLPPYYRESYFSSTSPSSSARDSLTATSLYTTTGTSASFTAGPGELTGRGLNAFGKMALSGVRSIIVRRRLQTISSNIPHADNTTIPGLGEMYNDLLELSRYVIYTAYLWVSG